jgi:D-3-phosphoglycerate dehydrogenase
MPRWRVVVTDSLSGWDWTRERDALAVENAELDVFECQTQAEVADAISSADVVMNHLTVPVLAEALERTDRCRAVIACGTGHDHIDVDAAGARGIAVATIPGYCTDEVSDHALAVLLALSRKLFVMVEHVRRGRWDARSAHPVNRLQGRTLGLLGFGRIARRLAAKAQPLGLRILALDPLVPEREMASAGVQATEDLWSLLAASDYLSLHAPVTAETTRVLDADAFAAMKSEAVLINCSRGELVDENALFTALVEGRLAGAALDVAAEEPMPANHPLLALDNVIVTPHAAWLSIEAEDELHRRSAQAVLSALRGELPEDVVNASSRASFWWLHA